MNVMQQLKTTPGRIFGKLYLFFYINSERYSMDQRELLHVLIDKIPDAKIVEAVNFLLFIQSNQINEYSDLLSAAENNLGFWDSKEDEIWNNV